MKLPAILGKCVDKIEILIEIIENFFQVLIFFIKVYVFFGLFLLQIQSEGFQQDYQDVIWLLKTVFSN